MAWGGNLADLRAWWAVLRCALRMAPHPASYPGAGEGSVSAYVPKVLALIVAAHWLSERLQRAFNQEAFAPLQRLRALAERLGIDGAEGLASFDRMNRQAAVPDGMVTIVPPWVITTGAEVAVLLGAMLLAARLIRPRLPWRPALALALAAFAAATLYDLIIALILFRTNDALGISAGLAAAVSAEGRPLPGFDEAIDRLSMLFMAFTVVAPLPLVAMVICLARGLRAARHRWLTATPAAVVASGASVAVGFLARRTGFGDALVRFFSF
ncbi:hypothetical protein ACLF3G_08720 [Falsiroseomonas sp. HC035]|uniref:hypothetical protein n=1 Tax=Falsiroseomonas sp. HC035 TaxID=3390999 RepID=UPI003D3153C0